MKSSILFLLFLFLISCDSTQYLQESYDKKHPQKPVSTYQEIDAVLASFKTVNYYQLDKKYIKKDLH